MLLVYNYVLLKMSTWYSKHVEESNNILRINNSQCIKLVIIVWWMLSCIWSTITYVSYMRLSVVAALAIHETPKRCVVAKHIPTDRASYPTRPEYSDRLLITHWKMGYRLPVLKRGKISKIYWRCQTTEQLNDDAVISKFQERQVILRWRTYLGK